MAVEPQLPEIPYKEVILSTEEATAIVDGFSEAKMALETKLETAIDQEDFAICGSIVRTAHATLSLMPTQFVVLTYAGGCEPSQNGELATLLANKDAALAVLQAAGLAIPGLDTSPSPRERDADDDESAGAPPEEGASAEPEPEPEPEREQVVEEAMTLEEATQLLAKIVECEKRLEDAVEAEDFGACKPINEEIEALSGRKEAAQAILDSQ